MVYLSELRKAVGHRPLLAAGATVLVVKNDQILLNLRADTKTWGIPGGSMELGETLEEAARRELLEETNLNAQNLELLHVFSGKPMYFEYPNGDKVHSVAVLYKAQNVTGELQIADDESLKLQYFAPDDLPTLESRSEHILNWVRENRPDVLRQTR